MIATFTFDIDTHFVVTYHIVHMSQTNPAQAHPIDQIPHHKNNQPNQQYFYPDLWPNVASNSTQSIKACHLETETDQCDTACSVSQLLYET